MPTIDRDTETLTDQIYRYTNNMARHARRFTHADSGDDSIAKEPRKY